jgi:hypothetical protein
VLGDVLSENRCRCKEAGAEREAQGAGKPSPWGGRIRKIFG